MDIYAAKIIGGFRLLGTSKYMTKRLLTCLIFLIRFICLSASSEIGMSSIYIDVQGRREQADPKVKGSSDKEIRQLDKMLEDYLSLLLTNPRNTDYQNKSKTVVDNLSKEISLGNITDRKTLSDSYYLIGIYYLIRNKFNESINYLVLTTKIKDQYKEYDDRFTKALYNLSICYTGLGDYKMVEYYSLKSLEMDKKIYGDLNPSLINSYMTLVIAYIGLQEYEKAINNSNIALKIAGNNPESVSSSVLADIYSNMGVCYTRMADFSKAKIYQDKSESIKRQVNTGLDENYINLMNSQAITYGMLGLTEKANDYYEKGILYAISSNSGMANNMINSYAIVLAHSGKADKGKNLLQSALERSKSVAGEDSAAYIEVLNNYADYLREYNIDNRKSIRFYISCMNYLKRNSGDRALKYRVILGYSLALAKDDKPQKAYELIQTLINTDYGLDNSPGKYENPHIESIKSDNNSLKLFQIKYDILWDIYRISPDQELLEAASNTSELIVSLIEKIRINISEDDSRLVLGDRYRDSYFNAIRDLSLLFNKTSDNKYIEQAFEYSEKSKVAGLLTSARELKAVQFHIPSTVAEYESELKHSINILNAKIAEETGKDDADSVKIHRLNEKLLESTRLRDSLILVFEHMYPGYYSIKYNTRVASVRDIPEIVGRNGNYINYLLSDTMLYIFVANRRHNKLLAIPVDSSFFSCIKQFRSLLSMPAPTDDAVAAFNKYQTTGFRLYKTLIEPIRPFLISDKIIISPDNILSYIPFETIPTSMNNSGIPLYRNLPYLMNDFDIFYTYSATLMAEPGKENFSLSNRSISFAPNYSKPIDIQSILMSRQGKKGILLDLPFARQEAEFVAGITKGKLYEYSDAKESVYKAESGKYDIIHLAMHTLLNDKDPMRSTLIFSPETDSTEDGFLKTYEVYALPLRAKMVVLSSCNTGTGFLYSGEGILSLARGFIYSGSKSVVMSMWEIEDKSGTEIVRMFYKNLKKGYSKSAALRKARIDYLKNANQLRSHPYFWSTLIVYGNNAPLYYTRYLVIGAVLITLTVLIISGYYFRKRKYS